MAIQNTTISGIDNWHWGWDAVSALAGVELL
jgi:hypothetical protein